MGEVVIDGVVFEFDPTGTKLVKKVSPPSPSPSSATADAPSTPTTEQKNLTSPTSTPLRTSVNGQAYVRTKGGNLISAALLAKRRAQKEMAAKMRRLGAMGTAVGEMQAAR